MFQQGTVSPPPRPHQNMILREMLYMNLNLLEHIFQQDRFHM
jgi:hypothetical protein